MNFIAHILVRLIWPYLFGWTHYVPKVFWAFFVIFVITSAMTGKFYHLKYYGAEATGKIIGSSGQNGVEFENPKWVQFKTRDGKVHAAKLTLSNLYSIGDEMKVYYDPQNPMDSYANSHWNSWILFVLGLVIVMVSGVSLIRAEMKRQEQIEDATAENYSDAVHYDAPRPPPKDGCICNIVKVIALIMLIVGVGTSYKYLHLSFIGDEATAKVITTQRPDVAEHYSSPQKQLYALDNDGAPIFFTKIKLDDYEVGDEIEILYDPDNAEYSLVNNVESAYGLLLIGVILMFYAWAPWLIRSIVYQLKMKIYRKKLK